MSKDLTCGNCLLGCLQLYSINGFPLIKPECQFDKQRRDADCACEHLDELTRRGIKPDSLRRDWEEVGS